MKQKTYCFWFKMKNSCAKCVLLRGDPSPPLSTYMYVDTNVIYVINYILNTASDQKLDIGKD